MARSDERGRILRRVAQDLPLIVVAIGSATNVDPAVTLVAAVAATRVSIYVVSS